MNYALSSGHDAESTVGYHHQVPSTGQRIREKREGRGLSQEKLAHEVGVTRGSVAAWEIKNTIPQGAALDRLALALGVTTDWILRGDRRGEPEREDVPDPPHWAEFLERYEHLDDLDPERIEEFRRFAARNLRPKSWVDHERIVEIMRTSKESAAFESAKRKRKRA